MWIQCQLVYNVQLVLSTGIILSSSVVCHWFHTVVTFSKKKNHSGIQMCESEEIKWVKILGLSSLVGRVLARFTRGPGSSTGWDLTFHHLWQLYNDKICTWSFKTINLMYSDTKVKLHSGLFSSQTWAFLLEI